MRRRRNEHFEIWGADLLMPLIEDCGYNEWHTAEPLSWHSHQGYELVLLLEGSASFEFVDGPCCELSGGEFFFKLPREVHRATNDVTSPCKMCWIVFDPTVPSNCKNTTLTKTDLHYLKQRYSADQRQIFTFSAVMRPLLENFRHAVLQLHSFYTVGNTPFPESRPVITGQSAAFADVEPPQVALLRSYICQILLESAHLATVEPSKKATDLVGAAIAFMEGHYQDSISVDQISDHLGLSRSYLYAIFREGTGQTPNDYLQRLRVKAAQIQLTQSSASITEVATNVGFSSSQYFSKVFRKYTHQTPQEYRKVTPHQ